MIGEPKSNLVLRAQLVKNGDQWSLGTYPSSSITNYHTVWDLFSDYIPDYIQIARLSLYSPRRASLATNEGINLLTDITGVFYGNWLIELKNNTNSPAEGGIVNKYFTMSAALDSMHWIAGQECLTYRVRKIDR